MQLQQRGQQTAAPRLCFFSWDPLITQQASNPGFGRRKCTETSVSVHGARRRFEEVPCAVQVNETNRHSTLVNVASMEFGTSFHIEEFPKLF